ncbi:sialidase family protein [Paenibacillus ginsengarvi]|uniref:Exo-alpha-sialidase n=1 Tax=Paenibacillus ginsengarvi TaxID=400777 RepID=A0A3B0CMA5_9BACL|nr:sialidase family protein [Paenibacillus ginsengarvi]RKN85517.1 exo-alpha-sialidase [Paenibacillus ginsengarvi]
MERLCTWKRAIVTIMLLTAVVGVLPGQRAWSSPPPCDPAESGAGAAEPYDPAYSRQLVSQIAYSDASSGRFLGSPSLVRVNETTLLASHDYFGASDPNRQTTVYRSVDNGATWAVSAELDRMYWSNLFVLNGNVYLLG